MEISHVRASRIPVPLTVEREVAGDQKATAATVNETRTAVQPVPAKLASSATENRRDGEPASEDLGLRVSVDQDARQIVFQTVDSFTGEVVAQTPDKAMLRQRAYVIQVEDARIAAEAASSDRAGPAVERSV